MTVEEYETIRLIEYMDIPGRVCGADGSGKSHCPGGLYGSQEEAGAFSGGGVISGNQRRELQNLRAERTPAECVRSIIQERRFKHEDCSDI